MDVWEDKQKLNVGPESVKAEGRPSGDMVACVKEAVGMRETSSLCSSYFLQCIKRRWVNQSTQEDANHTPVIRQHAARARRETYQPHSSEQRLAPGY